MPDFDFSTLITTRSQSDVDALRALISRGKDNWTAEELAEFNLARSRGAYNYTDLNRVTACVDYLAGVFQSLGYRVPGYKKVEIPRSTSRLPDGYTELEYIESSGTQYIDTGFKPNQDTRVVMDAYLSKKSSGATYFIGLAQYEPSAYYQVRIASTAQHITSDFGADTKNFPELPAGRYVIDKNKNICTIGASVVTNSDSNFQSVSNLLLLSGTTTAGAIRPSPGKIYSCKIYDNGTLIRDYVPAGNSSGVVGLYDLVGGQFYGNEGTGDFIAGPNVQNTENLSVDDSLDPYTWYETDVPTQAALAQYLTNVQSLMDVLTTATYSVSLPDDMALLTYVEANNIEKILTEINTYLETLASCFLRSGMSWATAGSPGFYFAN